MKKDSSFGEMKEFTLKESSSCWPPDSLEAIANIISLAHVINENKRANLSPKAISEIWAYWDMHADEGVRGIKVAIFWGERPGREVRNPKQNDPFSVDERHKASVDFLNQCLSLLDAQNLEFPKMSGHSEDSKISSPVTVKALLARHLKMVLVYRDSRIKKPFEFESTRNHSLLWRARRQTLMTAAPEVSDLLISLGVLLARQAKGPSNMDLNHEQSAIEKAYLEGLELAQDALNDIFLSSSHQEHELNYNFACRALGEIVEESSSEQIASAMFKGFFSELGRQPLWSKLAGSGENEAFFPLLCQLEPFWEDALEAKFKYQPYNECHLNWSFGLPKAIREV